MKIYIYICRKLFSLFIYFHFIYIISSWYYIYIPSRYCRSYGDFPKKISPRLVSLIKVEGLFAPYIISIFDIVNSGTSVQRYIQLVPSLVQIWVKKFRFAAGNEMPAIRWIINNIHTIYPFHFQPWLVIYNNNIIYRQFRS